MQGTEQVSPMAMIGMVLGFWAIGGFLVLGAVKDWDWIFNSRKYRLWVKLFGRSAVRLCFGAMGAIVAAAATILCVRDLLAR